MLPIAMFVRACVRTLALGRLVVIGTSASCLVVGELLLVALLVVGGSLLELRLLRRRHGLPHLRDLLG